jgi:hypothetical protein
MADEVVFERMLPAHSLSRMPHFYSSVHAAVDAWVSPARHDMNPHGERGLVKVNGPDYLRRDAERELVARART